MATELTPDQEKSVYRYLVGARNIGEVLEESGPDWLIEGWLASSATMVDGQPEAGKSTLAWGLAAAVATGSDWRGMPVTTSREGPVLVICTDPGDRSLWAARGQELEVPVDRWELLTFDPTLWADYGVCAEIWDCRMVVFDNVTGALDGAINDADPTKILNPLTRIVELGVPVVALAHSGKDNKAGPMGPTAYKAWRRHGISVKKTKSGRKVSRTGNLGTFPDIDLESSERDQEITGTKRDRKSSTLDKNRLMANWVVANCQGVGVNEAGKRVSAEFGGTQGSRQHSLKKGALSKMLMRTGDRSSAVWELKT